MGWFKWPRRRNNHANKKNVLDGETTLDDEPLDSLDTTTETTKTTTSTASSSSFMSSAVHHQTTGAFSTLLEGVRRKASFSVVLTPDDLKALEIQNQIQALRRKRNETQRAQRKELNDLRKGLRERKATLQRKLRDGLDRSDYEGIAQQCLADLSNTKADGDHDGEGGHKDEEEHEGHEGVVGGDHPVDEEKVLFEMIRAIKTHHSSDLLDRVNKMVQEQTNDEIMRMYNMEGTIKEDFGEREAKMLSHVVQMDTRLGEMREGHEERVKVCETMKARYEKTAQDHVSRVYKALREPKLNDGQEAIGPDDVAAEAAAKRKGRPMPTKSYSDRLLEVNAEEMEERRKKRDSLLEAAPTVIIEFDGCDDGDDDDIHGSENKKKNDVKAETNGSERSERTTGSRSGHRRLENNSGRSERTTGSNSGHRHSSLTSPTGSSRVASRSIGSPRLQAMQRKTSLTRPSATSTYSAVYATRTSLASRTSPSVTAKTHATSHARTNLPSRRVIPAGGK